jgi:hypothetical protein
VAVDGPRKPMSLIELVEADNITEYSAWSVNTRKGKPALWLLSW